MNPHACLLVPDLLSQHGTFAESSAPALQSDAIPKWYGAPSAAKLVDLRLRAKEVLKHITKIGRWARHWKKACSIAQQETLRKMQAIGQRPCTAPHEGVCPVRKALPVERSVLVPFIADVRTGFFPRAVFE